VSCRIIDSTTADDRGFFDNEDDPKDDYYLTHDYDYSEGEREQEAFYGAFHSIMQRVSTTLHTLFIITTFYGTEIFPPFPMPNLVDFGITSTCAEFSIYQTFLANPCTCSRGAQNYEYK